MLTTVKEWLESRDDEETPIVDAERVKSERDALVSKKTDPLGPTKHTEPLSTRVKMVYGFGEWGYTCFTGVIGFYLNAFLLEVAGVPPGWVGTILLIAKMIDAVMDPVIGWASDRTRTRFGRRKVWIALGMVPLAVCYLALWIVPVTSPTAKVGYYACMLIATSLFISCVQLPVSAMAPELTDNYDERTTLMVWKMIFFSAALITATFLQSIIIERFYLHGPNNGPYIPGNDTNCYPVLDAARMFNEFVFQNGSFPNSTLGNFTDLLPPRLAVDYQLGYLVAALCFSCLSLIPLTLVLFCVPERSSIKTKPDYRRDGSVRFVRLGVWDGLKAMFSNRGFICVMVLYLMSQLAIQFVQNNLFLFVKYSLRREEWFSFLLLLLLSSACICMPVFERISRVLGKSRVYLIGALIVSGAFFVVFFFPYMGQQAADVLVWILAVIGGFGLGALFLAPVAMFPDVVEQDELKTGVRREGLFYAFFVFFQKMALAVAVAISNFVLASAGYTSPESSGCVAPVQPASAVFALNIMMSFVPAGILLVSLIALFFYPITRELHLTTLDELHKREQQRSLITTDGEVSIDREGDRVRSNDF